MQDAITGHDRAGPPVSHRPVLIIILGLVSSVISAILAAIILAEIVNALPIGKQSKIELTVVACFSIGLGAGLTPLGEPLTTIVIAKLAGDPYHADFLFLLQKLGIYIIPTIFVLGAVGLVLFRRSHTGDTVLECIIERESLAEVVIRAGKVYLFIMALIFLGEGFKPLILQYILGIPPAGLYWVNIVSASARQRHPRGSRDRAVTFNRPDHRCPHGAPHRRRHADPREYPEYHLGVQA